METIRKRKTGILVIERKPAESIKIVVNGTEVIWIDILRFNGKRVKVGIEANRESVQIKRGELCE